jgi:hypothetical protein
MAVKFRRKRKSSIPPLVFDRPFWTKVAAVLAADQVDRVEKQRSAAGGAIKRNAQSTLDRKQAQGKPPLSLVDEKQRFIQERFGSYEPVFYEAGRGVKIRVRSEKMRNVARHLIKRGYEWIGMSRDASKAIRALFRADIRKQLRRR